MVAAALQNLFIWYVRQQKQRGKEGKHEKEYETHNRNR